MEHIEMVEKLAAKTGVTYAEAKAALEENNWDMLDALIALEQNGKVNTEKTTASYTTTAEAKPTQKEETPKKDKASGWEEFKRGFCTLMRKGMKNHFIVTRLGEEVISVPVLILILVACCCFWLLLPLLVVGLFCDCRYSFQGEDLGKKDVNDAMEKASVYADDLKQSVKNSLNEEKNE